MIQIKIKEWIWGNELFRNESSFNHSTQLVWHTIKNKPNHVNNAWKIMWAMCELRKSLNHMLDIIERNINTSEWALSTFWIKSTFTGPWGLLEYVQRYLMEKISSIWLYVDSHITEWKIIAYLASNVQFKGTASNMKLFLEAILGLAIVQSKYYPPLHSGLHI